MLTALSIKNLAVIESVEVEFDEGFQVFTGETGAGKSMIIDAIGLVLGGRGSVDIIRHGADKAEIECLFLLDPAHPVWDTMEALGLEPSKEESLVIRREITNQGKSLSRINGRLVNQSMMKEIGSKLVHMHGQHEHQTLLKSEEHLKWLDGLAGAGLAKQKQQYQALYKSYTDLRKELKSLEENSRKNLQMADLYRYQVDEIEEASLRVGEEEDLEEERKRLSNAEKLFESVSGAHECIYGPDAALERIGQALKGLEQVVPYDSASLSPLVEQIRGAFYQLEDGAFQLRAYRDDFEFNPERLAEVELRLDTISGLKRKYGASIKEILHYAQDITEKLEELNHADDRKEQLTRQLQETRQWLEQAAEQLTDMRRQTAERLASRMEAELKDLHMEKTRFAVHMEQIDFAVNGSDSVEFMISPNPGEPLRSLGKIASGGELSRMMLALKTIFAGLDATPVMIFDEVDTGVSGRAAQAIANKLAALAGGRQIFAITHLPQVACMADRHYSIRKEVQGERTFTLVHALDETERVSELARMLGGVEVTETTRRHAEEMIALAEKNKDGRKHLQS